MKWRQFFYFIKNDLYFLIIMRLLFKMIVCLLLYFYVTSLNIV